MSTVDQDACIACVGTGIRLIRDGDGRVVVDVESDCPACDGKGR